MVPRPSQSAAWPIRTAASSRRARSSASSHGLGAISTSFWLRRCRLHSRSQRWTTCARAVAGDLHLDVARAGQERLDVHLGVAERAQRLGAAARVGRLEILCAQHRAHAAAASARDGLDHHRAVRALEVARLGQARRPVRAGQDRHAAALRERPRARLVAELLEHLRARSHEPDPGLGARAREGRVLGQESVAGVDRVAAGLATPARRAARCRGRRPRRCRAGRAPRPRGGCGASARRPRSRPRPCAGRARRRRAPRGWRSRRGSRSGCG